MIELLIEASSDFPLIRILFLEYAATLEVDRFNPIAGSRFLELTL